MIELAAEELPAVRVLFEVPPAQLILESMIAGYTSGTTWADSREPSFALIHSSAWILLSGDRSRVQSEIDALLRSMAGDRSYLKILTIGIDGEVGTPDFLPSSFDTGIERSMYGEVELTSPEALGQVPSDYKVQMIDSVLLSQPIEYVDELRDEIDGGWPSQTSFIEDGFGFCGLQGSSVVSWCTGEYLSPGKIGIGIETVAGHQRQGLATAIASGFVGHAIERGLLPHWDCWTGNAPSVRTAERVGFKNPVVYEVAAGSYRGESD